MDLKIVPISEVEVWKKNPKNIKKVDYERLKRQIIELGVYKPLICIREDGKYITLGGNMRLRALQELKHKEVDISVVKAKDEATKIKYSLSDNDRAGEYDDLALAELVLPHVEEINLDDYKVDIGSAMSMTELLERFGPEFEDQLEDKGTIPAIPKQPKDLIKKYEYIHVEFSGGKDSLLALLWARKICKELKKDFTALFVETGAEFPDLSSHINRLCEDLGVNLVRLNSKENIVAYYTKKGCWPDPIYRDCQHQFINEILDAYKSENQTETLKIRGGRPDQRVARTKKTALQTLKNGATLYAPFYETPDSEYKEMIKKAQPLLWPGYEKGFIRTACWCCPFQKHAQYEAIKLHYPLIWEEFKILTQRLEYPAHKGDSTIRKYHAYWDPWNGRARPRRESS